MTLCKPGKVINFRVKGYGQYGRLPRGYLLAEISTSLGKIANINTHLSLDLEGPDLNVTQFDTLKRIAQAYKYCVVTGDFNINPDQVKDLNDGHFLLEEKSDPTVTSSNIYQWRGMNRIFNLKYPDLKDRKLDYVLVKAPSQNKKFIKSKVISDVYVSDHNPLLIEVEF